MNASKACFWLAQSGAEAGKLNKLLDIFTPLEVWDRFDSEPKLREFFGAKQYGLLAEWHTEEKIDERLRALKQKGIGVMTREGDKMPERLKQREVCPPLVLYYRGDPDLLSGDCLAVVGTRHASRFGAEAAQALIPDLVRGGLTVVSGLATGIDAYALRAALDSGGRPISVLASGLDMPSPVANIKLFEEVCARGVAVSEYPPDRNATKYTFVERNRLISGLSLGVLIVEAPEKSGALITADYALEQGREVFAVPGNITSSACKGSNALLKEGAIITLCADDVLSQLGFQRARKAETAVEIPEELRPIVRLLEKGEAHFDAMCEALRKKPYELAPQLTMLEIMGLIVKRPNNYYDVKK